MIKPGEFGMNDYLNKVYDCTCTKKHKVDIKEIDISRGALNNTPLLIKKYGYKKVFIVSDLNTSEVAGKRLENLLTDNAVDFCSYVINSRSVVPNEETLGSIMVAFDNSCDLILAVGSGTINDICKFLSFKLNLDYFILATAPSMDGFASSGAALIVSNMKTTYETHVARVIIADTDILKAAPANMIAAGLGDLIGKYTCLCDWKIANIVNGEYYCHTIVDMVKRSLKSLFENTDLSQPQNPDTVAGIMEGLFLTGIAMSYVKNSRPASGSEHHLSHYWEMMFLSQGKEAVLHGTKVGIATIAVVRAYESLITRKIDFNAARVKARAFQLDSWEKNMIRAYGAAATGVIELEKAAHKNTPAEVEKRIDFLEGNWDMIITTIKAALPSSKVISALLKQLGIPESPSLIGVDDQILVDSIIAAKELRQRYGLLQMLFDLGIIEELAIEIKNSFAC